jgi:hypothetical protein
MATRNKKLSQTDSALKALQGKAPPKNVVRDALAEIHRRRDAEQAKSSANQRHMAKQLDQVQKEPRIDARDPDVSRSLEALVKLHQKYSKQKLLPPKVADVGDLFPGRITASTAPPFDFDHVLFGSGTGTNVATREATASRQNGQINVSAVTSSNKGFGGGSAFGVVGLYFHPIGSGVLTVRASPKFSFQRWTNSIQSTAVVRSFGSIVLNIFGVDAFADTTGEVGTIVSNAATVLHTWDEQETNEVRFDFKFDQEATGAVSINANHTLVYYLFISAEVAVHGVGWPGSLAGSKLSVTVPSISYDYEFLPVLTQ